MSRHNRTDIASPARRLRRLVEQMEAAADGAPPAQAAALLARLAPLGVKLAEAEAREAERRQMQEAYDLRRAFDDEVMRLIELRAREHAEAWVKGKHPYAEPRQSSGPRVKGE